MCETQLKGSRLQLNGHFLHAFLVVVDDILEVFTLEHCRLELLGSSLQFPQIVSQQ